MSKKIDETMQSTIDFAKNVLPEKSSLDLQCLFAVLLQQPEFNGRYPVLEKLFPDPPKLDSKAESLKPDKVVRGVFKESKLDGLISSELVFKNVLFHEGLFDGFEAGQRITLQSVRARYSLKSTSRHHPEYVSCGIWLDLAHF